MPGPEEQQNGSHRALVPHRPAVAEKMILLLWRDQFQTVLSGLLASLHSVMGLLNMYRCVPREHIRVFLSSLVERMDDMLSRANQGLLSTAVTVDQLWDKNCMSWIEVRRLEVELGAGGDHDQLYNWSLPPLRIASARLDEVACQARAW
jgi:hypothetical protein